MTTFLFWNLRGNHAESWPGRAPFLAASLGRLAFGVEQRHPVDVFVLAECRFTPDEAVAALGGGFAYLSAVEDKVQMFARRGVPVESQFDDTAERRLTVRQITTASKVVILLAGVHLPSPLHHGPDDRARVARIIAADIARVERDAKHSRTVVVGDFNMDPYNPGMTAPDAFQAVMVRRIAARGTRTVGGKAYRYFYNPTWSFFGDRTPGPPGTHYYAGSSAHVHWHLFDQVLLRPGLMDKLADLRILDWDGRDRLTTRSGRPDRARASDHLPILFRLDI